MWSEEPTDQPSRLRSMLLLRERARRPAPVTCTLGPAYAGTKVSAILRQHGAFPQMAQFGFGVFSSSSNTSRHVGPAARPQAFHAVQVGGNFQRKAGDVT